MSELHSIRPLLHINVILVIIAHCVQFTTEGSGHHPLSHYHRGSDIATDYVQCLAGNVEVLFCVLNVLIMFYLRQVVNFSLLNVIHLEVHSSFRLSDVNNWSGLSYMEQPTYKDGIT